MKGWISLELSPDGSWTYSGHLRSPGKGAFAEAAVIAVKNANGVPFFWSHTFTGTAGQSQQADWRVTGTNNMIKDAWPEISDPMKSSWGYEVAASPTGTTLPYLHDSVTRALGVSGAAAIDFCK